MLFVPGTLQRVPADTAGGKHYDAVVVGSGVSGAIIANELSRKGKTVLVVEAGLDGDQTLDGYQDYLNHFFESPVKDNQAPYPPNPNADMPRSPGMRKIVPGQPDTSGYFVQEGPYATDTVYTRVLSGTTMHWEAKILRMLPDDFRMRTLFGHGADWPITYKELQPYYRMAERELGVSGDVDDQRYLGQTFDDGYVYPMHGLPLSYLDRMVHKGIAGTTVTLDGNEYSLRVRSFPQARNGVPNPGYDGGKGYDPVGAVTINKSELGGRCQGNINCVPICPVQAKYNAGKTMAKAMQTGRVDILVQSVASKVHLNLSTGRVSGIEVKTYHDPSSAAHTSTTVRGTIFVLAANAIENARLMLASGLPSTSGLIGRNLMDHAYLLNWGLLPEVAGTGRGTVCTGGISELRTGSFREQQAAFNVDIHNDGWGWATGAPYTDIAEMVDMRNKFGAALRRDLASRLTRQLQLALALEVPPVQSNRVSVDSAYKDQLGNMRPVISYAIPEYTMRGAAYARKFARLVFQRLGVDDHTVYDPSDYGYVTYEGEGYAIRGGHHLAGTHVMGKDSKHSVVDTDLRSWDHDNLYLVGGGAMPTIGTSNITNTLAALCFKSAAAMIKQLK